MTTTPSPAGAGTRSELIGIQYLRGIAAMMVVAYHVGLQLAHLGYAGGWLPGLAAGVDVFFVISGFIMWVTTFGKLIGPAGFWRKRIVRIVPLYWLITTVMVALMIVAPHAFQTSRFDLGHIIKSYLFIPAHHPIKNAMEPVVFPGWTLNYEMFFYLIFGVFLLLPPKPRFIGTVGTIVLLAIAGTLARADPLTVAGFYSSAIMIEFTLGMAIGAAFTRGGLIERIPPLAGALMAIGGLLWIIFAAPADEGWLKLLICGVPAAFVVIGMIAVETGGRLRDLRVLHLLGNASYSIYLTHFVVQSASTQLWHKLHLDRLPGGLILFGIVATALGALGGILCFWLVETRLSDWLRPRRPANSAPFETVTEP